MYNIYIYGAGKEYDNFMAIFPLYKSFFNILGIVTSEKQIFFSIDGYEVIQPQDIKSEQMDYIIIAVDKWHEIFKGLVENRIDPKRIIRASVFKLPYFDFEKYIALRESDITILSNSCIGGRIYNKLGLEILSPTKNMYCLGEKFVRFTNNLEYYLEQEMVPLQSDEIMQGTIGLEDFFQKGKLDDIIWTFNHNIYAEDAIKRWNEHVKKVNKKNIAIIMIILNDEELELFKTIKFERKIGIYYKNINVENVICCPMWNDAQIRFEYSSNWIHFANDYLEEKAKIDWLSFLSGNKDYSRCFIRKN